MLASPAESAPSTLKEVLVLVTGLGLALAGLAILKVLVGPLAKTTSTQ